MHDVNDAKTFYTEFCERCSAKNLEPEAVFNNTYIIFISNEILEFTAVVNICI